MSARVPETAVAAPVVGWLRDMEWDVYQEVEVGGDIADIVATKGQLIWVVEAKTSLSLKLLAQANRWLKMAHYVSIAVPFKLGRGRYLERDFVDRFLREKGIGKLTVRIYSQGGQVDVNRIDAKFCRRVDSERIRKKLHEKQKTILGAGSKGGGYWTPFKSTCEALREFVGRNPGCTLKSAIDGIAHHYASPASARGSLANWIKAGKIKGVAIVDRKVQLVSEDQP